MTTIYKSVHIEGKWPFTYEATARLDKNAKERERYKRKKAASVKTLKGVKLLKLPVYNMTESICERLNNV